MPTHRQHYVPRIYLKFWETEVESLAEPQKKFIGIYAFTNGSTVGNGVNRNSVLWKQSVYTISFEQLFISQYCPLVYTDFVNQVYELMRTRQPAPVYGKLGYSVIKTKESVRKHLKDFDNWDFFYENGDVARKKGIINDVNGLNSYILEDGFEKRFESEWEKTVNAFTSAMDDPNYGIDGDSVRNIPAELAEKILSFAFMLMCRNPKFDGMGIYTWLHNDVLQPVMGDSSASLMSGIWYTELYRMMFKQKGGHYHSLLDTAEAQCQMIYFKAYNNAGSFITSDNPVFINHSTVLETKNMNGIVFPLSPECLIFICKGSEGFNRVDYRMADSATIRYFNQAIYRNKIETVIASKNDLSKLV